MAAVAFAKAKRRRQIMVATSSIGPGALNMVTAAGIAHANRLPVLLLSGDTFVNRVPDPVLQQVEPFGDPTVTVNDPSARPLLGSIAPRHCCSPFPAVPRCSTPPSADRVLVLPQTPGRGFRRPCVSRASRHRIRLPGPYPRGGGGGARAASGGAAPPHRGAACTTPWPGTARRFAGIMAYLRRTVRQVSLRWISYVRRPSGYRGSFGTLGRRGRRGPRGGDPSAISHRSWSVFGESGAVSPCTPRVRRRETPGGAAVADARRACIARRGTRRVARAGGWPARPPASTRAWNSTPTRPSPRPRPTDSPSYAAVTDVQRALRPRGHALAAAGGLPAS